MRIARHAVTLVERDIFKDIRSKAEIPEKWSLIKDINQERVQNMFEVDEKAREDPLQRDILGNEIFLCLYGKLKILLRGLSLKICIHGHRECH